MSLSWFTCLGLRPFATGAGLSFLRGAEGHIGRDIGNVLDRGAVGTARGLAPAVHDVTHALLPQDALNTLDRVSVFVKQVANAAQQFHVLRTIIPPSATALQRA